MILAVLWIISLIPLLFLPYSIALFYQRSFMRNTYPYLFLISLVLYIASSLAYIYPAFSAGNWFFALAGMILGGASIRLHQVMTKRWQ